MPCDRSSFILYLSTMTWVTPELKEILKHNAARYFASKGEDRDDLVATIVSALQKAKDDLPHGVSKILRHHT
jgi:hypothetical protein